MTNKLVSAGQTSGGTVNNGGTITVLSGGITSGLVLEAGYEVVFQGGLASGTEVQDGYLTISSGGLASNAFVEYFSVEYVFAGGTDRGATIDNAFQYVEGGAVSDTVLSDLSLQEVLSGGTAIGSILATAEQAVISGTAFGTVVSSGGEQVIVSGQLASGSVVSSGGLVVVESGSMLNGAEVLPGGTIVLLPGALAAGTMSAGGTVVSADILVTSDSSSGIQLEAALSGVVSGLHMPGSEEIAFVLSGATLVSAVVGGVVSVGSGGSLSGTVLSGVGTVELFSGGLASGSVVNGGGFEIVGSGGVASGSVLDGVNATQIISSGGSAVGTWVLSGDQEVYLGGTITGTVLGSRGSLQTEGVASGLVVGSGGTAAIGGVAISMVIESGGDVLLAGVASNTVLSGGYEFVFDGYQDIDPTLSSGAVEVVSGGGMVSGASVLSGATLVLEPGALAIDTASAGGTVISANVIVSSGQNHVVVSAFSGAVAGLDVGYGASAVVLSGGSLLSAVIENGAVVTVSTASVSATLVSSGGMLVEVVSGGSGALSGTVSGTVLLPGGGIAVGISENVFSATVVFNSSTDVLTLAAGSSTYSQVLGGSYQGEYFHVANGSLSDNVGFVITLSTTPCYRRGTLIKTVVGDVSVEDLQVGDRVVDVYNEVLPIKWIGRRSVDCVRHGKPEAVWPVRVMANAFAEGAPRRDLFLSPDHAVFVDEVLVPIGELVNGITICQVEQDTVEYFHVELDRHAVILAEGLPAESFLDTGNRCGFDNGSGAVDLNPDFAARSWDMACAELVIYGPKLATVRARLEHRACSGYVLPSLNHAEIDA